MPNSSGLGEKANSGRTAVAFRVCVAVGALLEGSASVASLSPASEPGAKETQIVQCSPAKILPQPLLVILNSPAPGPSIIGDSLSAASPPPLLTTSTACAADSVCTVVAGKTIGEMASAGGSSSARAEAGARTAISAIANMEETVAPISLGRADGLDMRS